MQGPKWESGQNLGTKNAFPPKKNKDLILYSFKKQKSNLSSLTTLGWGGNIVQLDIKIQREVFNSYKHVM